MRQLLLGLVLSTLTFAQLPPQAQQLFERARAANPQRMQFALDRGADVLPTTDGRSFYLHWAPARNKPLIVTLHGSASWAHDEFFLWHEQAVAAGYGIVVLQWWFGGDGPDAYYGPSDLHRELRAALKQAGARPGTALLHGFSRGASNLYGVAALDRTSRDRYYAVFLANAGGASEDFPPNLAISRGDHGFDVFSGTYWILFCGGLDPNPARDGCPAMRRTSDWIARYGGVTDLLIDDARSGHGGFHQTQAHMRAALDRFGANLALRTNTALIDARWEVRRDPEFEIRDASTPNVGWVGDQVSLIVGSRGGPRMFRSSDGSNSSSSEVLPPFSLNDVGYGPGEIVPRQDRNGTPVFYVLALAPPGSNRSAVFRFRFENSRVTRDPQAPVFSGGDDDANFVGVPDITPAPEGRIRLTYVARGAQRSNSRTAISSDDGATFAAEFPNPFGDLAIANPSASQNNVDPSILQLAGGGYIAVTMRGARLYLFTSVDGRTFVPSSHPPIEASQLAPGATGLFDPTLVQLPDGRVYMYVTAGSDPGSSSRVVRAEIVRLPPRLTHVGTMHFEAGTRRPQLLATGGGELIAVHEAGDALVLTSAARAPALVAQGTSGHAVTAIGDDVFVAYSKDGSTTLVRYAAGGAESRKTLPIERVAAAVADDDHLWIATGSQLNKISPEGDLLETTESESTALATDGRRLWPVGSGATSAVWNDDWIFVAQESSVRALAPDWRPLGEWKIGGEATTLARIGNRLFVAWDEGDRIRLDEYTVEP